MIFKENLTNHPFSVFIIQRAKGDWGQQACKVQENHSCDVLSDGLVIAENTCREEEINIECGYWVKQGSLLLRHRVKVLSQSWYHTMFIYPCLQKGVPFWFQFHFATKYLVFMTLGARTTHLTSPCPSLGFFLAKEKLSLDSGMMNWWWSLLQS